MKFGWIRMLTIREQKSLDLGRMRDERFLPLSKSPCHQTESTSEWILNTLACCWITMKTCMEAQKQYGRIKKWYDNIRRKKKTRVVARSHQGEIWQPLQQISLPTATYHSYKDTVNHNNTISNRPCKFDTEWRSTNNTESIPEME